MTRVAASAQFWLKDPGVALQCQLLRGAPRGRPWAMATSQLFRVRVRRGPRELNVRQLFSSVDEARAYVRHFHAFIAGLKDMAAKQFAEAFKQE